MFTGPNISQNGLVFAFDSGYGMDTNHTRLRYNQGEPTTNIIYAGNTTLNNGVYWTNSGTGNYNNNDVSTDKPKIPQVNTSGLQMMSGETIVVGSQHVGCAGFTGAASTTYTISVYFRQNRAGSNQPYFRTNVNNNSLGNFNYKGDTNAANWPVNEWIRISCTATLQSNETGGYLSNYIGSEVGDKIWYFAPQVEQKSHATPFALGTRSHTQGVLDGSGNAIMDTSLTSFDAYGRPVFDGTNDYIPITTFPNKPSTAITCEGWCKPTKGTVSGTIRGGVLSASNSMYLGIINSVDGTTHAMHWANQTSNNRAYNWNGSVPDNQWAHLVGTYDGSTARAYVNGVEISNWSQTGTITTSTTYYVGTYGGGLTDGIHNFNGLIGTALIYNRALSAIEVLKHYEAGKNRFKN